LEDFESYIHDPPPALPFLIQLALIHYQFETIHPFLDGNGRMGRMLITLLLCKRGFLPSPLLYLSAFFEERKDEYINNLLNVSQRGVWSEWIQFFLQGVAEQARDAVRRAQQLQDLQRQYQQKVRGERAGGALSHLVDELFVSPGITISGAARILEMSYNAARLNVEKLVSLGILHEATGRKRDRVFIASDLTAIIDEPK